MRVGLILAALLVLGGAIFGASHALGQKNPSVGIDMDITGNNDSKIGTIDNCAKIPKVGDTLTFDLVVKEIDPAIRIAGYQVDIDYDPNVIQINSVISSDSAGSTAPNNVTILSRIASGGGSGFVELTEGSLPDTDGSFTVAVADGTGNPSPPANHEDGEGVLARITVEAVGTGVSDLIIPGPLGGPDANSDLIIIGGAGQSLGIPVSIDKVYNAAVSVGKPCKPSSAVAQATETAPQSTPIDGASTDATPQTETTPQSGTPGAAETPTDGTPGGGADTETPGPGTAVLGGTSESGEGDEDQAAGGEASSAEESDGDGLSAGAWAGIGVGIAAAVLAASGIGWIALKRRRAGGTPTHGGEAGSE